MFNRLIISGVVLSFLFKLILLTLTKVTFYSDDAIYAYLAKLFLTQGVLNIFHPTWPPLYPFVGSLFVFVVRNYELSFRLVSVTASVLLIIPLYFLTKKILDKTSQFFYLLSILFIGPLFKLSLLPFSDVLSTLFIITSLSLVYLGITTNNFKLIIYSGFVFGLSFLTRSEGALFFYLTFIFLLFCLVIFKFKIVFLKTIFIFTILFFITISPYLTFMYFQFGDFSLSHKFSAQVQQGHAFALINNTTWAQEIDSTKYPNYQSSFFYNGVDYVLNKSDFFIWWFKQKAQKWLEVYLLLFPKWSLVLILIGISKIFFKGFNLGLAYLLFILLVVIPVTVFSTAVSEIRYLLWTIPILLLFYYLGVNQVCRFLLDKKIIPLILILFSFSLPVLDFRILNVGKYSSEFTNTFFKPEILESSNWINSQNKKSPKIMMRHEGVEFYTSGETIYTPQINIPELLTYAKYRKVDYLVAWTDELANDENLKSLLDPDLKNPGLELEKLIPSINPKILIYSLK